MENLSVSGITLVCNTNRRRCGTWGLLGVIGTTNAATDYTGVACFTKLEKATLLNSDFVVFELLEKTREEVVPCPGVRSLRRRERESVLELHLPLLPGQPQHVLHVVISWLLTFKTAAALVWLHTSSEAAAAASSATANGGTVRPRQLRGLRRRPPHRSRARGCCMRSGFRRWGCWAYSSEKASAAERLQRLQAATENRSLIIWEETRPSSGNCLAHTHEAEAAAAALYYYWESTTRRVWKDEDINIDLWGPGANANLWP